MCDTLVSRIDSIQKETASLKCLHRRVLASFSNCLPEINKILFWRILMTHSEYRVNREVLCVPIKIMPFHLREKYPQGHWAAVRLCALISCAKISLCLQLFSPLDTGVGGKKEAHEHSWCSLQMCPENRGMSASGNEIARCISLKVLLSYLQRTVSTSLLPALVTRITTWHFFSAQEDFLEDTRVQSVDNHRYQIRH